MTIDQIPMTKDGTSMSYVSRAIFYLVIGAWSLVIPSHLFAAGLVAVGSQPHGGLSGKIVYVHGGHGITAANEKDGEWSFQRGPSFQMIEDLGNVDQMTFFVDYLF